MFPPLVSIGASTEMFPALLSSVICPKGAVLIKPPNPARLATARFPSFWIQIFPLVLFFAERLLTSVAKLPAEPKPVADCSTALLAMIFKLPAVLLLTMAPPVDVTLTFPSVFVKPSVTNVTSFFAVKLMFPFLSPRTVGVTVGTLESVTVVTVALKVRYGSCVSPLL